jgi:prolyl-tRNA synthetase
MGSYGIGVERAIAVIAEVHHDDAGLAWPTQVAPAEVTVLALSVTDEAVRTARTCTPRCRARAGRAAR